MYVLFDRYFIHACDVNKYEPTKKKKKLKTILSSTVVQQYFVTRQCIDEYIARVMFFSFFFLFLSHISRFLLSCSLCCCWASPLFIRMFTNYVMDIEFSNNIIQPGTAVVFALFNSTITKYTPPRARHRVLFLFFYFSHCGSVLEIRDLSSRDYCVTNTPRI